jgi:hypothetical protein
VLDAPDLPSPRRRINGEMRLPQRDHLFRLVLLSPPQKLI